MWVRTPDDKLAFLLDHCDLPWNSSKFASLRIVEPNRSARVRTPSGQIKQFRLADLRFDSEAASQRRFGGTA